MPGNTIVFIHGLFVTRKCWDPWVARYQERGYTCHAVAYPGRDKPVGVLKQNRGDSVSSSITISEVIDHLVNFVQSLDEQPLLIGHSFGGLFTQILLQRGLGAAGVAIDSAPPQGLLSLERSFLRCAWPGLNPTIPVSRPYYMSFEEFRYAFVHTLTPDEQRAAYDQQVVPESRRLWRGALTGAARVDFRQPRAPLLLIAGTDDHIIPASLNRTNYERYKKSPSVTDFKEFPGRTHYIVGQPGWEEVADYALDWAARVQAA